MVRKGREGCVLDNASRDEEGWRWIDFREYIYFDSCLLNHYGDEGGERGGRGGETETERERERGVAGWLERTLNSILWCDNKDGGKRFNHESGWFDSGDSS